MTAPYLTGTPAIVNGTAEHEHFDKSGLGEWSATQLADAILAAGWTRCQHPKSSGFSNNNGPWEMRCAICGKDWTEPVKDRSEWEGTWTPPEPPTVPPPHDIDVERAPYCTVCGRDVQWDDDTDQWEH